MLRTLVYLLFFASGISGLVYEILWMRKLTLIFGCTTYATSAVLTSFMGGLALGAFLFGRFADRLKNPLRFYAFLEFLIGGSTVLVMMALLPAMDSVYVAAFRFMGSPETQNVVYGSGPGIVAVRFLLAIAILIVPATLMGGTLPVISRYFIRRRGKLGLEIANLYAVNTVGAAFGCFLCGFFLIRACGEAKTMVIAVGINVAVGLATLLLSARRDAVVPVTDEPAPDAPASSPETPSVATLSAREAAPAVAVSARSTKAAFWAFGLAGFASLAYEVIWTRALINVIGSDVYCFTVILTTFLCGITLGSFVVGRFVDRIRNLFLVFGLAEILIGCMALASIPLTSALPDVSHAIQAFCMKHNLADSPFSTRTVSMFGLAFLIFIGPTFLMGAVFPLVNRIYQRHVSSVGRNVGDVYSVNTLGTIFGSAAAGLLILPFFGIAGSIVAVSVINLSVGVFVTFLEGGKTALGQGKTALRQGKTAIGVFRMLGLAAAVASLAAVFITGSQRGVPTYFEEPGAEMTIPFYEETPAATLYVKEYGGQGRNIWGYPVRKLVINRHPTAHNLFLDIVVHKMLAHVPVLLHENPKRGLVVGFGLGSTSYSMLRHAGMRVDCVELLEEEIKTAAFFERENRDIINSEERFRLIINDGRNYVLAAEEEYDVISVNAIDPRLSPALYTWDFYKLCRDRMGAGGVMALWLPTYGISCDGYLSIYRSFQDVFPHSFVLYSNQSHFLLVGSAEEIRIDLERFLERAADPAVKESLGEACLDDPLVLLSTVILTPDSLKRLVAGARLNTDEDPTVEFDREEVANTVFNDDFFRAVVAHRSNVIPFLDAGPEAESRIAVDKIKGYADQLGAWMKGQILYNTAPGGRSDEGRSRYALARQRGMAQMMAAIKGRKGNLFLQIFLAVLEPSKMEMAYFRPHLGTFCEKLGEVVAAKPEMVMIHHFMASGYSRLGDREKACESSRAVALARPDDWYFQYVLGMRCLEADRPDEAALIFDRLLDMEGGRKWGLYCHALLLAARSDRQGAVNKLHEALEIDPDFVRARTKLEKLTGSKNDGPERMKERGR
jgi:spermidine synthase